MRIELQIRTRLQHLWATAVETAGLYTKKSLKSGQGENGWLEFFMIVSSLFSFKEKLLNKFSTERMEYLGQENI